MVKIRFPKVGFIRGYILFDSQGCAAKVLFCKANDQGAQKEAIDLAPLMTKGVSPLE